MKILKIQVLKVKVHENFLKEQQKDNLFLIKFEQLLIYTNRKLNMTKEYANSKSAYSFYNGESKKLFKKMVTN